MSRGSISRRAFLAGAGGAAVGGLLAAACGGGSDGPAAGAAQGGPSRALIRPGSRSSPAPATGLMASFTVLARDRARAPRPPAPT